MRSRKKQLNGEWQVDCKASSVKYFAEFNKAEKSKNLQIAKYSVEFIDFSEQQHPHRRPYWRLLGRPVCEKNCGKTVIFYIELSLRRFRLDSRL